MTHNDKRRHLGHALGYTGNGALFVGRRGAMETADELNTEGSQKLFKI